MIFEESGDWPEGVHFRQFPSFFIFASCQIFHILQLANQPVHHPIQQVIYDSEHLCNLRNAHFFFLPLRPRD